MFCIKCGNRLGEHMKFCDQCGAPVPVDSDEVEVKKENLKDFKAPIIDKDPMDLVPEEFEEKPSESEKVKEEIAEEIKEGLNLSRESQKEDLFKEEKVEKVEAPKILDEPLDERENYSGEAGLSPVKIIALVFMIVTGIASIATILAFFGFFFSFIGGLL